jgi:hypothetical protein
MRKKIILAICIVFILVLLIWWCRPPVFEVSDIVIATVLIIVGYPIIIAVRGFFGIGGIILLIDMYVIIRAIVGFYRKDKYAKTYRILAVIVWVIGGWFLYMLQFT